MSIGIHVIDYDAYDSLKSQLEESLIREVEEMQAHSDECDMHSETNRMLANAIIKLKAQLEIVERALERIRGSLSRIALPGGKTLLEFRLANEALNEIAEMRKLK